jgi:hypothetical protein
MTGDITLQEADAILINYPYKSRNEKDYNDYPLLQEIFRNSGVYFLQQLN